MDSAPSKKTRKLRFENFPSSQSWYLLTFIQVLFIFQLSCADKASAAPLPHFPVGRRALMAESESSAVARRLAATAPFPPPARAPPPPSPTVTSPTPTVTSRSMSPSPPPATSPPKLPVPAMAPAPSSSPTTPPLAKPVSNLPAPALAPAPSSTPSPTPTASLVSSAQGVLPNLFSLSRKKESGPAPGDLACVSQGVKSLCPFVDPLPRPATVAAQGSIKIGIYEITQQMHRDLPETPLFAYGLSQAAATVPGPTLEAKWGSPVQITWENQIGAAKHPLPVDDTIMRAKPVSGVPTVVHLHGGEVSSLYDGHPDAWFTKGGEKGAAYTTNVYTYGNRQDPATLWYHDHTLGFTRLNVQMGLAGFYILRNPSVDNQFKLPRRGFEIPLVIKDFSFRSDGSVDYPGGGSGSHPVWEPEFFGDAITVNGIAWPYLEVLPRKYRFRLLNACNARFLDVGFSAPDVTFKQIGTDGGYLSAPVVRARILIAPGERADVIVDFRGQAPGTEIVLTNRAAAPFPDGDAPGDNGQFGGTAELMKFIVRKKVAKSERPRKGLFALTKFEPAADAAAPEDAASDDAQVPGFMQTLPNLRGLAPVVVERWLTLSESEVNGGPDAVRLGILDGEKNVPMGWMDRVTETPRNGATELWHVINFSGDAHPIHVHLVKFRLVSRYAFDDERYGTGQCKFNTADATSSCVQTGTPLPIDDNEAGWKDTVRMYPGHVTTIVLRFTSQSGAGFGFDPTKGPGYVWHCHIL
ncbi:hypothetical protein KFL_003810010 [Klebsormidium nitens]|uniref:Bilirubin oxidase n=1 Tax=Klebsormidium nitens TaxID=105231 RepID=A0A1Y1IGJ5_KLENI|nr:hypothetical protein KFL_003810010 [Klebsormidium nitens]|eukprot:GAQ87837.1 hypothetical protein KFL_003810010 [Klebsormidium nitens]